MDKSGEYYTEWGGPGSEGRLHYVLSNVQTLNMKYDVVVIKLE